MLHCVLSCVIWICVMCLCILEMGVMELAACRDPCLEQGEGAGPQRKGFYCQNKGIKMLDLKKTLYITDNNDYSIICSMPNVCQVFTYNCISGSLFNKYRRGHFPCALKKKLQIKGLGYINGTMAREKS